MHAARTPERWAESLASLHLVQTTATGFAFSVFSVIQTSRNMDYQLRSIRQIYKLGTIPNMIPDGTLAFPQNPEEVENGI